MGQFRTVWYKILCYNGRVKEDGSGLAFVYELFSTQRVFCWMPNSLSCTECSPCPAKSHWYPAYANRLLKVGAQCRMMPKSIPGKSFVKDYFKEPLNNKPYILVKHAIQAFFQNTGLIFTQICLFSLVIWTRKSCLHSSESKCLHLPSVASESSAFRGREVQRRSLWPTALCWIPQEDRKCHSG